MRAKALSVLALFLLFGAPLEKARADSDLEAQLRAALRGATTQLRGLQDEQAVTQAKQAELEKQNQALRQQVATLMQQGGSKKDGGEAAGKGAVNRAALDQAVAEFNQKLAAQNQAIGQMSETLDKWKSAYNEAVTVARTKEAERAQLAGRVDGVMQHAESCEAKNAALFKLGSEILDRYQHMDLGDALGAREPFIGFARVKLENIAQDYHDKLLDQKIEQKAAP